MIRMPRQRRPRRRPRPITAITIAAWLILAAADAAALAQLVTWMPAQLHTLAVGACLALTVVATWARQQVPIRAAFLSGVLFAEQSQRDGFDVLPRAVGDGQVVHLNPASQRRPAPHRRGR